MKGRLSLEQAEQVGARVVDVLTPHCEMIAVAGSVRRRKPVVGDVDIVAVPSDGGSLACAEEVLSVFEALGVGSGAGLRTRSAVVDGIQVDLWLVRKEGWGASLQFATGSKEENIRLRVLAKRRGWKLSQYGLFNGDGRMIAGETEESVYEALGVPFRLPWERDQE
jgi:DNA polymerase (family 10)